MGATNILYSGIFIFSLNLYLHNLNGVPENVSILTAPGFKVKLIFHHRPVSTATNRSLLAHRYNFVGNSSGNKEFLPEHPRHHPIALTSIIGSTVSF